MIAGDFVGEGELLGWLRDLPNAVQTGLARVLAELAIELQSKIQQDELSGQILAVRTGSLKSSIDVRIDQSAEGVTATVFTDSEYAAAQEYGFTGTVNVRASLRRIQQAFGRPISKTVDVRAHSRRMHLPEHSFLRSALEEMTPAIRDAVEGALRDAVLG